MSLTQRGVVLVEEEETELVDPVYANSVLFAGSKLAKKLGRFLKPRAATLGDSAPLPRVQPLLREVISGGVVKKWPPKVLFCGWCCTSWRWDMWVQNMRPLHGRLWLESGIKDAVEASTFNFGRDEAVLFGLLECWCPETSSFVLPWPLTCVEATVTLEDVMIMGGFPILGEPVGSMAPQPAGEAGELVEELDAELRRLMERNPHRVRNTHWMEHHMESQERSGGDSPLEHAAFLTMWLSMFVFPGPYVRRSLFPIAARLATGKRVALGPAVLASLYRDLSLMKQQTLAEGVSDSGTQLTVWAPFHLLQLWAWEHFMSLRPKRTPHFLHMNQPRAARWRCCDADGGDISTVRTVLGSPAEFRWRPYVDNVDSWARPPYYRQVGRWYSVSAEDDLSLGSLLHCLRAGELQGLDCEERYAPHRVAMQFGLDQDVPAQIPWSDANWEPTWTAYDRGREEARFYVPSQLCKPRVTDRFLKWQKQWMAARMVEVEKFAVGQEDNEASKGQEVKRCKRHHSSEINCITSKRAMSAAASDGDSSETVFISSKGVTTDATSAGDSSETGCITSMRVTSPATSAGDFSETDCTSNKRATTAAASEQRESIAEYGKCTEHEADGESLRLGNCNKNEAHTSKHLNSGFQEWTEDPQGEKSDDGYTEKETLKNYACTPTELDGEDCENDRLQSNAWKNTVCVKEDCGVDNSDQLEQSILQELEEVDLPPRTGNRDIVMDAELERQKDLEFEREILQLKAEIAVLEEQLKKFQSEADTVTSGSEEEEEEEEDKIVNIE